MLVIHINRQRIRHISGCNICEVLLDVPALRSWFPCSIELHMTIYGNCVCLFLSVANRMNILTGAAYLKEEELKGFDNYKVSFVVVVVIIIVVVYECLFTCLVQVSRHKSLFDIYSQSLLEQNGRG